MDTGFQRGSVTTVFPAVIDRRQFLGGGRRFCDIRTRGVRNVSLKEMIGVLREACRITEKAEVNDLLRV